MSTSPLSGGCGCGAVRFVLDTPPTVAAYCHCTRCQRRTGTGAACTALVDGTALHVDGEEHVRTWEPGGGGFGKAFCAECGSALFVRDPETGAIRGIRMGAFDTDPGVRPALRQWTSVAVAWEAIPEDGLPRHPEQRPS